jgi:hypothetical protein
MNVADPMLRCAVALERITDILECPGEALPFEGRSPRKSVPHGDWVGRPTVDAADTLADVSKIADKVTAAAAHITKEAQF